MKKSKLKRTTLILAVTIIGLSIILAAIRWILILNDVGDLIYDIPGHSDLQSTSIIISNAWDDDIRKIYVHDSVRGTRPLLLGKIFRHDIELLWSSDGSILAIISENKYVLGYDFNNQQKLQAPSHITKFEDYTLVENCTAEEQDLFIARHLMKHGGPDKIFEKSKLREIGWLELYKYKNADLH